MKIERENIINVNHILRLNLTYSRKSWRYHWEDAIPEKRSFFGKIKRKAVQAGWTNILGSGKRFDEKAILEEINTIFFKRGGKIPEVWEKTRVEIESIGGKYTHSDYVYFNTDKEALEYVKEISSKFPHISVKY